MDRRRLILLDIAAVCRLTDLNVLLVLDLLIVNDSVLRKTDGLIIKERLRLVMNSRLVDHLFMGT